MPRVPKVETPSKSDDRERSDSWESDQKERDYYYDDSHGYEVFVPDDDEAMSDTIKKA